MDNPYTQQEQALGLLKAWVSSDNPIYRLSGYSGTGKSYTIATFLGWYRSNYPDSTIAAIAPSHKAKKNLSTLLGHTRNIDVATISSFLGLTPQLNENTGKIAFGNNEANNLKSVSPSDYDLVVIDEYSMIPKEQVLLLNRECKRLIYLGDPAQLPPIGEDSSLACALDCISYELTQVVRYTGDLARIAATWRKPMRVNCGNKMSASLVSISTPEPIKATRDKSIQSLPKIQWIEQCASDIKCAIELKEDIPRIITFTNKCADKWNQWIRSELHETLEPYNIGDLLICKKPLFRVNSTNGKMEIKIANSTELTVVNKPILSTTTVNKIDYSYYCVEVQDEEGFTFSSYLLTDESKLLQTQQLKLLYDSGRAASDKRAKQAIWGLFYQLQQTFDDIGFAYAITTHKSQGSTYPASYLDLMDLNKCSDKMRLIYTALTRSKQVYIYE